MAMTITQSGGALGGESSGQYLILDFDALQTGEIKVPLGFKPGYVRMFHHDSSASTTKEWVWVEPFEDQYMIDSGTYTPTGGVIGLSTYTDSQGHGLSIKNANPDSGDRIILICLP